MPSWLERLQRAALFLTAFLYSAGYATVGLVLLLITVVIEAGVVRGLPWRRTPVDLGVVGFLGIFVLSGYVSPYRAMAIAATGLAALTIYLALGVPSRVISRDAGVLRPLLWAWLAGAAVAAAWALTLHLRTGAPAFTPELGQNAVGTTMLIGALVGCALFLSVPGPWRFAAAGMSALALGALALSHTRGAWLGAALGLVLVFIAGGRVAVRRIAVVVAAVAVIVAALAGAERTTLVRRALSIPNPSTNANRLYLFRTAGAIAADHPLLGTGMNTFPLVYPKYRLPGDPNPEIQPYAHNIFLNIAAEGGLIALATFLAIVFVALRGGWRWRAATTAEAEVGLRTTMLAAFAGIMVHQLVDGTLLSVHLGAGMWMLIAILTARPR